MIIYAFFQGMGDNDYNHNVRKKNTGNTKAK